MIEVLKNFLISTAALLVLDWGGKLSIQRAFAIGYRKQIPYTYSLLPVNKLIAFILLDIAATNDISAIPPRSDMDANMMMVMVTFGLYMVCIWKPYKDEVLAQPDEG